MQFRSHETSSKEEFNLYDTLDDNLRQIFFGKDENTKWNNQKPRKI